MSTSLTGSRGYRGSAGGSAGQRMTGDNIIPKGYQAGQLQQFTPEQMQLFKQLFSHVGPESYLSRLGRGDQGVFEQLEAPAMKQFGQFQSDTANRFSFGGGDRSLSGRHGSGFQNALTQGASDFAQQLQANRLGLQRQAIKDLMGISKNLLGQSPYSRFVVEPEEEKHSWLGASLPFAGSALGAGAGFFAGGPAGALAGAKLGGALGAAGSKAFF